MKEVLITVKELLDNGGSLYKGELVRNIYYKNGIKVSISAELYKDIIESDPDNYYVKIRCTPHYI